MRKKITSLSLAETVFTMEKIHNEWFSVSSGSEGEAEEHVTIKYEVETTIYDCQISFVSFITDETVNEVAKISSNKI